MLKEKYKVEVAYLFMGEMPEYRYLYRDLRKAGYEIIFKEIAKADDGKIKGNIDGELILQAMIDYKNYKKAVLLVL
jgi:spore maturation protein CgeB